MTNTIASNIIASPGYLNSTLIFFKQVSEAALQGGFRRRIYVRSRPPREMREVGEWMDGWVLGRNSQSTGELDAQFHTVSTRTGVKNRIVSRIASNPIRRKRRRPVARL